MKGLRIQHERFFIAPSCITIGSELVHNYFMLFANPKTHFATSFGLNTDFKPSLFFVAVV